MGIHVEFNPDLALRNFSEFKACRRKKEECIPKKLEKGRVYYFLKKGQRNYWLEGEIPLVETNGSRLSLPLASIVILESTHTLIAGEAWTKGTYKVKEIFEDSKPGFNGFARL